jgi:hypothetical protein
VGLRFRPRSDRWSADERGRHGARLTGPTHAHSSPPPAAPGAGDGEPIRGEVDMRPISSWTIHGRWSHRPGDLTRPGADPPSGPRPRVHAHVHPRSEPRPGGHAVDDQLTGDMPMGA